MFRGILKSCGGNANTMSGFMHAVIELDKATDCNEYLADLFSFVLCHKNDIANDFIYPNTDAMRLMLANLAEGYPIEYITKLIISESDSIQE